MADLRALSSDLEAEHEELDALVAGLSGSEWDRPTPADPWTVRDQISHLAFFDEVATQAVVDPEAFANGLEEIALDAGGYIDRGLERGRALASAEVLAWWRRARAAMLDAFARLDPATRVVWFGPPMSPASFITARLMETWAHGQDVVDAFGRERAPTDRLRHVAYLGVRARPFSYATRGVALPTEPVRVELRGPSGDLWAWGEEDAEDRIRGPALDFCLVVTQRRHVDDTRLEVRGPAAIEWMTIAQAFAGPPGGGRAPGQFAKARG